MVKNILKVVLAVAVLTAGITLAVLGLDMLKAHARTSVAVGLALIGLAVLVAVLILAARRQGLASLSLLAGVAGGVAAVLCFAFLRPGILFWIEQSEGVNPRALAGLVDNGNIAFASNAQGNGDLYLVDTESVAAIARITEEVGEEAEPAWSPDGERLAFTSTHDGDLEIYVMDPDGSDVTRLTSEPGPDTHPAWSPDGTQIAFTRSPAGNADIYVMEADGSDVRRITRDGGADSEPSWSPDGRRIAFTSDRTGNNDINVINVDGTGFEQLTNVLANDSEPAWSPDGSELLFVSTRDGDAEIFRYFIGRDKAPEVVAVTRNGVADSAPEWSPDGGEIAFLREDLRVAAQPSDMVIVVHARASPPDAGGQETNERLVSPVGAVPDRTRLTWQPRPRADLDTPLDSGDVAAFYAPVVYLHPLEARLPMDPIEFVRRARLDCRGRSFDSPPAEDLRFSPLGTDAAIDGHESYTSCAEVVPALQLNDRDAHFGTPSRSSVEGLYTGPPVLWERSSDRTNDWITYWFFYASSKTAGGVGIHQGDWERLSVCLPTESTPTVVFHQHERFETRPWTWARKLLVHPIAYSAKGSHAMYPTNVGRDKGTQDLTHEGLVWPTWKHLRELVREPWYGYRGRWGTIPGPSLSRVGGEGC